MNFEDRVKAIAEFGFTERQARFLVTVMLHAGVCVPRQYARFASTAYGHNVTKFFDRLVERRYATASDCLHNRAALYRVHHQALYRAIGQPQSRHRRPVSARQAIDRLRLLDGIISSPELVWLATEEEKVAFCRLVAPSLTPERLPHIAVGKPLSGGVRLFPDSLPIGIEPNGRVVFLYLVTTPFAGDLRAFLQRHADLLRALPGWTLQLFFLRRAAGMISAFESAAREELTERFAPDTIAEFKWYCYERRKTSDARARCHTDERFWQAHRAFGTPRCQMLYPRWLTDGDTAFELVSSSSIADALARGSGRIESHVLLRSYGHLSPLLVSLVRSSAKGVEEGDTLSARPQPPSSPPLTVAEELARDWYRLVAARKCSCGERTCSVCRPAYGAAFSAAPDSGSGCDGRGTVA
jgi:hypothetical protein